MTNSEILDQIGILSFEYKRKIGQKREFGSSIAFLCDIYLYIIDTYNTWQY